MIRNAGVKLAIAGFCFLCFAAGEMAAEERPLAADSNLVISVFPAPGKRVLLQIDYPVAFTSRLDVYRSANLQKGSWCLCDTNLPVQGSNTMVWVDSEENDEVCFFRAGNADLDSDSDGLADARETVIYQTNPFEGDSDSDGVPDGAEVRRGTDPVGGGTSAITLYVNSDTGSDGYDGLAAEVTGAHGPKHSLCAAYGVSFAGDVIQLNGAGAYLEPALCIGTSDVTLRPIGAVCVQP